MGMNWESALVIGFVVDRDDLEMPFKKEVPEKWHMEERFSSRTGKPLDPIKVVDREACEEFFLNDENLGDDSELLIEALEKEVDCSICLHGDMCSGEDLVYSIEPNGASGGMTLKEIGELQEECDRIRKAFKSRYGIDLDEPTVTTVMTYA